MELVIKVIALGIISTILCLVISKNTPELALCLAICTAVIVLVYAVGMLSGVVELIDSIIAASGLSSELISPVLKAAGIGILTKMTCDICKDAGQGAIASAVEFAGSAAAIYVALPLIKTVFNMIEELL